MASIIGRQIAWTVYSRPFAGKVIGIDATTDNDCLWLFAETYVAGVRYVVSVANPDTPNDMTAHWVA